MKALLLEIASWAFGAATIPVCIGLLVLMGLWFQIPEWTGIDVGKAVMGGIASVALLVLIVVIGLRIVG